MGLETLLDRLHREGWNRVTDCGSTPVPPSKAPKPSGFREKFEAGTNGTNGTTHYKGGGVEPEPLDPDEARALAHGGLDRGGGGTTASATGTHQPIGHERRHTSSGAARRACGCAWLVTVCALVASSPSIPTSPTSCGPTGPAFSSSCGRAMGFASSAANRRDAP